MQNRLMSADEARAIIAQMQRETPKPARVRVLQLALAGNRLSDDARAVYRAALAVDQS